MPTEDSFPGLARTLVSVLQSAGADFFESHRLRPDILVGGMKDKFLGGYYGVRDAVSRYIPPAAPRTGTPEVCTSDISDHIRTSSD